MEQKASSLLVGMKLFSFPHCFLKPVAVLFIKIPAEKLLLQRQACRVPAGKGRSALGQGYSKPQTVEKPLDWLRAHVRIPPFLMLIGAAGRLCSCALWIQFTLFWQRIHAKTGMVYIHSGQTRRGGEAL